MVNEAKAAGKAVINSTNKTVALEKCMERQRRKSKDLEQEIFGMGLEDVTRLRRIFNKLDEDKSGSIDEKELGIALTRAGREGVSNELLKDLMNKYDLDSNGTLEFNEYQNMISKWDLVVADIEADRQRQQAALAAAAPEQWPSGWGTPRTTTPLAP